MVPASLKNTSFISGPAIATHRGVSGTCVAATALLLGGGFTGFISFHLGHCRRRIQILWR